MMAVKYCSITKDGSYKYRFGAFRFHKVIPVYIRNHIEIAHGSGINGNGRRSIDNDSTGIGDPGGQSPSLTVTALNNLILLFRILLLYREASHCDSFYDVVGEDLGGWPGRIVQETQHIFVEGRRLFLDRFQNSEYILPPSVEFLCGLVEEWMNFQPAAQEPTRGITASWNQLRGAWRNRYQSDPGSLLTASPPRSTPVRDSPSLPETRVATGGEDPLRIESVPQQEVSPVVRAWVSALAGTFEGSTWDRNAKSVGDATSDNHAHYQAAETRDLQRTEAEPAYSWSPQLPVHPSSAYRLRDDASAGHVARSNDRDRSPSSVQGHGFDLVHSPRQKESPASQGDRNFEYANAAASTAIHPVQDGNDCDTNLLCKPTPLRIGGMESLPLKPPMATAGPLMTVPSPVMATSSLPMAVNRALNVTTNSPMAVANTATADSLMAIFGTTNASIQPPLAADAAKDMVNMAPAPNSAPVHKARRTPSDSVRRREARYNAEMARQMKPEVPNFVGALTSAAIVSALAPLLGPAGSVSPTHSSSSTSSSLFVAKYPESRGAQRGTDCSAADGNSRNKMNNSNNQRNNEGTSVTADASVVATANDKDSGHSVVSEQFILPDYLQIKQAGSSNIPGPKIGASESGINQGKKHARRSSAGVDNGPGGGMPERPRKRVSFGTVSFDNPEHQPVSPAQDAQTKRKSSLSITAIPVAPSLRTHSLALPEPIPRPASEPPVLVPPSPSTMPCGPGSSPRKVSSSPTKANSNGGKTTGNAAIKSEAPVKVEMPDKVHKPTTAHSPTKPRISPAEPKVTSTKPQATPAKLQATPTNPQASPAKPQASPTTPQAISTKKQVQNTITVSAKVQDPAQAPAVLTPRVHENKDNDSVLCDLRVREPTTPQRPVTTEPSDEERRADQAQAVLEFINIQTAQQLGCLKPLLKSDNTNNSMLQCNLEMIRAQLDALGYASRAALDRIKARQRDKENEVPETV